MPKDIVNIARTLLESGEDIVTAEIIGTSGSTPRHKGTKMLVAADGRFFGTVGGGRVEEQIKESCLSLFGSDDREKDGKTEKIEISAGTESGPGRGCGTVTVEINFFSAEHPESYKGKAEKKATAYIFGGGHVGLALEAALRVIDFETVVIDDRDAFASRERFPDAGRIIKADPVESAFAEIETDEDSYIAIMTHSQDVNYSVMRRALEKEHAYIGMLGSRRKIEHVLGLLKKDGIDPEKDGRVHAPIGEDIPAETPAEIAVSIAAEMITVRAGGKAGRKEYE